MAYLNKVAFSFALISFFSCHANYDKHLLTVYYEALCPDTIKFILEQLDPAVHLLQAYVSLKMVPFGNAHSVNGGESFVCQHGPPECLSNIIQDCVLHNMKNRSDVSKVEYVACEMKTRAASKGNYECVASVQDPLVTQRCVNSQQGKLLQLASEAMTKAVRLKGVPTVTMDGVYNQTFQDMAMEDLIGVLCQHLGNVSPCLNRNLISNSTIYSY